MEKNNVNTNLCRGDLVSLWGINDSFWSPHRRFHIISDYIFNLKVHLRPILDIFDYFIVFVIPK